MFDRNADYPTAVASNDDEGIKAAIGWCLQHAKAGDTISVWTHLKSNLKNRPVLDSFVQRHQDVEHITGRGGGVPAGVGPVLMAWPDMQEIGELVRYSSGVKALCVISWNDRLRPWVAATKPVILGDGSAWADEEAGPGLDPVLIEALKGLTLTVNHNNTISAGFEKDQVVGVLLALRDAGIPMDADAIQGWALAHGWSGKNPERLAQYVRDINGGKRPRTRSVIRGDYIETLRRRAAANDEHG
ncbi:hypothetical protein DFO47_11246 [Arthrobacter sp. AG258]|uniref:hypothetical protein n=1 Tax=Arthrobacter sp. AG258 TaxID=2183899 RepID=UPI0010601D39|nr:hypothetical protein [Arthrobacter sp. AG258]TDT74687.1 hypothetical protein DFO47_11246 [Arthrobacter sp. AG258]